jgi:hypothetical protein
MPMLVDANNQTIGVLVDSFGSTVLRKVGNDWLWLTTPRMGFVERDVTFYHAKGDCTDARLGIVDESSQQYAFWGELHSGALFYAKGVSTANVVAYETFAAGVDATNLGVCHQLQNGSDQVVGVIEMTVDPALLTVTTPFKIK